MKQVLFVFLMVVALAPQLSAQTGGASQAGGPMFPEKRVKALFLHTLQDDSDVASAFQSYSRNAPGEKAGSLERAVGLMYWMEVRGQAGNVLRATTNRTIRSGETVRIHVTANVDGNLRVYRRGRGGEALVFLAEADPTEHAVKVSKSIAIAIPSESTWLEFGPDVDTARIVVVLTPSTPESQPLSDTRVLTNPDSYDEIAASSLRRGQFIDCDEHGNPPATYVVMTERSRGANTTIAEIELRRDSQK